MRPGPSALHAASAIAGRRTRRAGIAGTVLPIALILMVALSLSAVTFVKMVNTSSLMARNAAFQRDAVNRNELAMNAAMRQFETGGGHFAQLVNTDQTALGVPSGIAYSAIALPTDSQGVPLALKDDALFAATFAPVLATSVFASGDGMSTRVIVERLCSLEQPADPTHCTIGSLRAPDNCSRCSSASSPVVPVFRVTARTDGVRGVQAYSQSLITIPFE